MRFPAGLLTLLALPACSLALSTATPGVGRLVTVPAASAPVIFPDSLATAPVAFKAEAPTVYYEILDASIDNHPDASLPDSYCGEVGGSRSFAGNRPPTHRPTDTAGLRWQPEM